MSPGFDMLARKGALASREWAVITVKSDVNKAPKNTGDLIRTTLLRHKGIWTSASDPIERKSTFLKQLKSCQM